MVVQWLIAEWWCSGVIAGGGAVVEWCGGAVVGAVVVQW